MPKLEKGKVPQDFRRIFEFFDKHEGEDILTVFDLAVKELKVDRNTLASALGIWRFAP